MLKFLLGTSHMCFAPEGDPAGGGGGGAPAAAAPATGDPAPAAAPAVSFLPNATPEDVAYVQSKGWDKSQNPAADILASYRNLEKVFGADKAGHTIVIPGPEADQKVWDDVYSKLGRPESADKYSEGNFEGMDDDLNKGLREKGHELGLTEKQLAGLREWNNEVTGKLHAGWEQEAQLEFQQQSDALDKEWGAAKDQNIQLAREATQKMGWTEEQVQAMQMALGFDGVMKLALNIGKSIGEGRFVSAEGGRTTGHDNIMTPAQAKIELNKLATDQEFMKQWTDKTHPKHQEAVQRKSQLSKWANPTQ